MNFLIIGLGSMGKRRVRCLKTLGYKNITGFDLSAAMRDEAKEKYNIKTIASLDTKTLASTDAMIISTPPDIHNQYIKVAIANKKPAFVEASVILEGLKKLNTAAKKRGVFIAPSCTARFHPSIRDIKDIVASGQYGKVTNFTYHCGQYLPDWHPWQNVKDFYVGQKATGGGREMVPFELTWLVDVVGFPKKFSGFFGKTLDVGADIDDTYTISMDFGGAYGAMIIDVAARYATRSLILNMEKGQILWRWDDNIVKVYDAIKQRWIHYMSPQLQTAEGYNKNINEDMYVNELNAFITAAQGKGEYPNTLDEDIKILQILNGIEEMR